MSSGRAGISEPPVPGSAEGLWNARRRRLQAALAQRDELFADLYRRAIDALGEQPLRRGSLVIAGHCIRDLVNGLPDVLTDVESVPAYSDITTPARELSDKWALHEDVLGPAEGDANYAKDGHPGPEARMTIPTVIFGAARRVVEASRAAGLNRRRRHSALVLGRVEVRQDPTVNVFRDSAAVFERLRHPQRGRDVQVTEETVPRLTRALEIIEGALEARMGRFFTTVEDLLDVLEAANARDEGDEQ